MPLLFAFQEHGGPLTEPHDDRLLIRSGRVIDPGTRIDAVLDVLIRQGRVAAVGPDLASECSDVHVLDATGSVVTPGFIDLHAHLRFPGQEHKESIASGTAAAAAGGFTTVCAMANTDPPVDSPSILCQVQDEVSRTARVRVRQLGALTQGLQGGELADLMGLAGAGAIAFSDDGKPVPNAGVMRQGLIEAGRLGKPISAHEEDVAIVGRGVANQGERARRLGLAAWPCAGEASMVQRDIKLLSETGGRLHIAHVSCAESLLYLREGKAMGLPVTAEVTPHHLCLTDDLLEGDAEVGLAASHPHAKVNPPLRSLTDTEALLDALVEGTVDAIATDHAPHAEADKSKPYAEAAFGLTGFELALPLLLSLVGRRGLTLPLLVERLTLGPAQVFRLPGGSVTPGKAADVCVFDPDQEWTVSAESLRSLGKNTPLLGKTMRGKVKWTLVDGKIVHG